MSNGRERVLALLAARAERRAAAPVAVAPPKQVARATAANVKFLSPAEHQKVIADRAAKSGTATPRTGVATAAPVLAAPSASAPAARK